MRNDSLVVCQLNVLLTSFVAVKVKMKSVSNADYIRGKIQWNSLIPSPTGQTESV